MNKVVQAAGPYLLLSLCVITLAGIQDRQPGQGIEHAGIGMRRGRNLTGPPETFGRPGLIARIHVEITLQVERP